MPVSPAAPFPLLVDPHPGQVLAQAFERAINCLRHHLAIDSLTTGMLDEMGIGSESVTLKSIRQGVNPLVPVGRAEIGRAHV